MGYPEFIAWGVYAYQSPLRSSGAPWMAVDGWAEDAEGRRYLFEVQTRVVFDTSVSQAESPSRFSHLPVACGSSVWVTAGSEYPVVVVDMLTFAEEFLEILVFGEDSVRDSVFVPMFTDEESAELEAYDDLAKRTMIDSAAERFEMDFGIGWRIQAAQAVLAAEVLAEVGFAVTGPQAFFDSFEQNRFSIKARTVIRDHLELMQPRG